jgi:hypothetical protein
VTLVLEFVGVVSAAALVRALASRSASLLGTAACVAVALSAFLFWHGVWPQAARLVDLHNRDGRLSREQALAAPGYAYGVNAGFLAWADGRLPRRARVFLDCPEPVSCPHGVANFITYRLQPRVFTDFARQANWVLFYSQPGTALGSARVTALATYRAGFAIGRLER